MSEQNDLDFGTTVKNIINKFGTDPHKLHRSDAPDTSVAAAHKVDTVTDEQRVFRYICILNYGQGVTMKEIAKQMQKQSNQISGRITALLQRGLVIDSGERRDGCRVIIKAIDKDGSL